MKTRSCWTMMRLALPLAVLIWGALPGYGQANPNGKGNVAAGACTVSGKTYRNCPPALVKQANREAARRNAAPVKRGVTKRIAGVNATTATMSALAVQSAGAMMAAPNSKPDYFGIANWTNSPLPSLDANFQIIPKGSTGFTGIRKFVDSLPGLCNVAGPTTLGQCIPIAKPDTGTTFSGPPSDFYRIGLSEYSVRMHSDLPATKIRGYADLVGGGTQQYLGPLIIATRNRPVRVLFQNLLAADLRIPADTTYMGAGMVSDGTNSTMASQKRAVLHLHGGNTPWISDGTPHQWITPAGGDGQPAAAGFMKGFSFQNVPDMLAPLGLTTNNLSDGKGTYYWTNQQSGRLMFFHDHVYGLTRLNVYAGEAAGYLLVDPKQEDALRAASAPGTFAVSSTTNTIDLANSDVAHVLPLVIQDKTFVPDDGIQGGQLAATDPTWDLANYGGFGSLWFPHVYMPNQNPADVTGANGFGRWDYGPWFWPPQNPATFVPGGQPYQCSSIAYPGGAGLAFPPLVCPGTPLPSGTPEGFMDTPVVNGTAYPTLTVDPTAYRFQMLNAANDRALNLGLYIADPIAISVTYGGSGYTTNATASIAGCTNIASTSAQVVNGAVVGVTYAPVPGAIPVCTNPSVTVGDSTPGITLVPAVLAVSVNTDVRMVPALPIANRNPALPDCSTVLPMAGGGQVTALVDASGNLLTPTGLPAGCWPQYNSSFFGPLGWPTDSREGGVPDPLFAGPPIVQLGAEGGVLPKIAVIPSTPVSYDYNKRSITVLNVLNHGLWLGPAERADIVVDFSKFAGQTLILYNDAPAPVPAGDPRVDYYTNNPDNSSTGGAPTTMAGFGPNTRTIMQIVVKDTTPSSTLDLAKLTAAVPAIFADTQDKIIIPEPAYPSANGGATADTYVRIQDTSVSAFIGGPIGGVQLTSGGAGYTSAPAVTIAPPCTGTGCVTASAAANLAPTTLGSITVTNGGSGYTSAPAVTITGGGGANATATAALAPRRVASVTITSGGNGYNSVPTVTFSAPPPGIGNTTATGTAVVSNRKVTSVTVTNPGSGYVAAPTITFTGGGGSGAAGTAVLGPTSVAAVTVANVGSGYTFAPTVTIAAPQTTGTRATATATITPTVVASVSLTNGGSGYTSAPSVTFAAPQTAGSTATGVATPPVIPLQPKTIQELFTLDYGRMNATLGVEVPFTSFLNQTTIPYGYVDPPTEIFKDGETQLWKITHNGVDTHWIHFHLFTVQVINRVGWDGAIKPPDPYEMGLKDTVRMNPLEDVIVALRPFKQDLPWPVPNSIRPLDVTMPANVAAAANEFTDIDPTNQPAAVTNTPINFGWEYVWHCHILGHEENDMMRPMILAVAPPVPSVTSVTLSGSGNSQKITVGVSAAIIANNGVPSGFTVQRATSAAGPWTTIGSVPATVNLSGAVATGSFPDTNLTRKTTYYYRAVANNLVGYTQTYAAPAVGYPHTSADSDPSPVAGPVTTN